MVSGSRLALLLLVFLYLILILLAFSEIVSRFDYVMGYSGLALNPDGFFLSSALIVALAAFMPIKKRTASSFILWIVFYFHIVPSLLFFEAVYNFDQETVLYYKLIVFGAFAFLCLMTRYHTRLKTDMMYRFCPLNGGMAYLFLFLALFVGLLVFYRDFGFSVRLPSFFSVYDIRHEYKHNVSPIGAYVSILLGYFLSPLCVYISYSFYIRRKFVFATFFCSLSIFLSYQVYAAAGFKSVAVMFLAVLGLAAYFRMYRKVSYGILISTALLALLVLGYVLNTIWGFEHLLMHWVRRVLVVPGLNVAYFFQYEFLYGFSPGSHAPNVISNFFYSTNGSANAGFIGDGVVRYGLTLFWLNFLVLYGYLLLIDLFFEGLSGSAVALLLPAAYALSNSSITAVLVTYGLALMLLYIFLFRRTLKYD